jgi:DNA-binding CsgD family transcriptional regulator
MRITKHPTCDRYTRNIGERLLEGSVVDEQTSCWNWIKKIHSTGYGQLGINGKVETAHRASYMWFVGPIPRGRALEVRHFCNNRKCINPSHLGLGTKSDNQQDSIRHGTKFIPAQRGEQIWSAKLTEEDVLKIRCLLSEGHTNREIAELFDIGNGAVSKIRLRQRWKHLA